jgi:hypothetical protein
MKCERCGEPVRFANEFLCETCADNAHAEALFERRAAQRQEDAAPLQAEQRKRAEQARLARSTARFGAGPRNPKRVSPR